MNLLKTRLLEASEGESAIRAAAEILRAGGLVAFPTETVYGLGARGLDERAVQRIFEAKGRPHSDPLILHVADAEWVRSLARDLPGAFSRLTEAFWPGPLTLVVAKQEGVPDLVTAGLDSVAVRMPAHPVALRLLEEVAEPLAAPSANLFGHTSPTTAQHVLADLGGRIEAVLDAGPTQVGVESTVVDLRGDVPAILRPGGVTREELERVLDAPVRGPREDLPTELRSPGMLTRHYSPHAEMRLYAGEDLPRVLAAMREAAAEVASRRSAAVLAYSEEADQFRALPLRTLELGSLAQPELIARNLYAALRSADEAGAEVIFARLLPPGGLADAINDRLLRAASGQVIRV